MTQKIIDMQIELLDQLNEMGIDTILDDRGCRPSVQNLMISQF